MKLVLIVILLVPLLVACGPNKIEVKFESDTENLNQLENRMMSGDIAYVIEKRSKSLKC